MRLRSGPALFKLGVWARHGLAGGMDGMTNGRRQGWGHVVVGCVVVVVGYLDRENIMSTKTLLYSLAPYITWAL